jgi:hypothetical protein
VRIHFQPLNIGSRLNQSTMQHVYTHAGFAFRHGSFLQIECLGLRLTTGKTSECRLRERGMTCRIQWRSRLGCIQCGNATNTNKFTSILLFQSRAQKPSFSLIHELFLGIIEIISRKRFVKLNIAELLNKGESGNSCTKARMRCQVMSDNKRVLSWSKWYPYAMTVHTKIV